MESNCSWEYKTMMNELMQGMEKAKQLQFHLYSTYSSPAQDMLLHKILSSYEKALSILNPKGVVQHTPPSPIVDSSISVHGSCTNEELNNNLRDHHDYNTSKKRKMQTTWSEQVRVNPENGLEGPNDDGYSWRKYGQKDILGAKYPRSYYRCTYRLVQNCWATKQVQRNDDDHTVFEITYKGTHACNHLTPEKQHMLKHQPLLDLKANFRVNTQNLDMPLPANPSFPSTYQEEYHFSPLFSSPATSETNYYSPALYNLGGYHNHQYSESDIVSAHTSTTNSPIRSSMKFPIDTPDFDPNFPFSSRFFK